MCNTPADVSDGPALFAREEELQVDQGLATSRRSLREEQASVDLNPSDVRRAELAARTGDGAQEVVAPETCLPSGGALDDGEALDKGVPQPGPLRPLDELLALHGVDEDFFAGAPYVGAAMKQAASSDLLENRAIAEVEDDALGGTRSGVDGSRDSERLLHHLV